MSPTSLMPASPPRNREKIINPWGGVQEGKYSFTNRPDKQILYDSSSGKFFEVSGSQESGWTKD